VLLKAAISVSPVPPIFSLTDQARAGALLGRFVRSLGVVSANWSICNIFGRLCEDGSGLYIAYLLTEA